MKYTCGRLFHVGSIFSGKFRRGGELFSCVQFWFFGGLGGAFSFFDNCILLL